MTIKRTHRNEKPRASRRWVLLALSTIANLVYATSPQVNPKVDAGISPPPPVTISEAVLHHYFANEQCEVVRRLVKPRTAVNFSPLTKAMVAFCETDLVQGEAQLKALAESRPTDEAILMLYGRYLSRWGRPNANDIWQKLVLLTKNPALLRLATDSIAGRISTGAAAPLEPAAFFYLGFGTAAVHASNPLLEPLSQEGKSSVGTEATIQAAFNWAGRHLFAGLENNFQYTRYFSAGDADLWDELLSAQVGVLLSEETRIGLKPFGEYTNFGQQPFHAKYGANLELTNTVANTQWLARFQLYKDWYYDPGSRGQQGIFYHVEVGYQSGETFLFRTLIFGEYERAGRLVNSTENIPYSNVSVGIAVEPSFALSDRLRFGTLIQTTLREDMNTSAYVTADNLSNERLVRQDIQVAVQPNLTLQFISGLRLALSYRYDTTRSNIGPAAYTDLNATNRLLSLGVFFPISF